MIIFSIIQNNWTMESKNHLNNVINELLRLYIMILDFLFLIDFLFFIVLLFTSKCLLSTTFIKITNLFLKNDKHQLLNHIRLNIDLFDSEILVECIKFQYQTIEQRVLVLLLLKISIELDLKHIWKHVLLSIHIYIK